MTPIPSYDDQPVPRKLSPFVRRLLVLDYQDAEKVTIPARPTGQAYIGWLLKGNATAKANGASFMIQSNGVHISGQLSAFDAEYSLAGPAFHLLAELTATGAFRLLKRDIGALQNKIALMDVLSGGDDPMQCFAGMLHGLAEHAGPDNRRVARAAQIIEDANGLVNITAVARELGMSDRHLRREFTRVVGIAPKPFAMIKRSLFAFQTLAMQPDADLADIVHEGGFADQSHLTKVFQLYLRSTPGRLTLDHDGVLQSIVARA